MESKYSAEFQCEVLGMLADLNEGAARIKDNLITSAAHLVELQQMSEVLLEMFSEDDSLAC